MKPYVEASATALPLDDVPVESRCLTPFQHTFQDLSHWCWAGVATSIALHFDPGSKYNEPCVVACDTLEGVNGPDGCQCCDPETKPSCNKEAFLEDALATVREVDPADIRIQPSRLSFQKLWDIMPRSLCVRVENGDHKGHFIIIAGVKKVTNADGSVSEVVIISDPDYLSTFERPYGEVFPGLYEHWTHTYYP